MRLSISCLCVAFVLNACSDSNDSSQNDDDAGGGPTECTLNASIEDRLGGADPQDCGRFAASDMPSAKDLSVAETCAIDASESGDAFVFVYEQTGIDSIIADAYVYDGKGGKVSWLSYDSLGGGIAVRECSGLEKRSGCETQPSALCLSCVDMSGSDQVCSAED